MTDQDHPLYSEQYTNADGMTFGKLRDGAITSGRLVFRDGQWMLEDETSPSTEDTESQ